MKQSGSFNEIIPIIALYAFAGYRLMPALQHIYSNITYIRTVGPSLDKMYNDFKNLKTIKYNETQNSLETKKIYFFK